MNSYIKRHKNVVSVSCPDKIQEVINDIGVHNDELTAGRSTKQIASEIGRQVADIFNVRVTRSGTRIKGIAFRYNLTDYYIQFNKVMYSVTGEPVNPTFSTDPTRYRTYIEYSEYPI